ncbi:MAG: hypothetical protein ABI354_00460 [Candidatus Saccharimonadales bacterium]
MKQTNKDQRTMDVAKPGKSLPDASSRPIIVSTRGNMMKDPMVKPSSEKTVDSQADEDDKTEELLTFKGPKVISPISKDIKADDSEAEDDDEDTEEDSSKGDKTPKSNEEAVVGAVIDKAQNNSKKQEAMDAQEAADKQDRLDRLVADKKYFVSVGQVARRKNKRVAVLLVILLIVVVAGYFIMTSDVLINK